jgi:AmmeMemoRadiSam system protein A
MVHSPSIRLSKTTRSSLFAIAKESVRQATSDQRLLLDLADYKDEMLSPYASFVTLTIKKQLRGCIGSLESHEPLVANVAGNAYKAARQDPRFTPVRNDELALLDYEISVLSDLVILDVHSESELLGRLTPGVDGLLIREGRQQATYLPSVWSQLPDPEEFLRQLKIKAGLPPDYWSDTLRVSVYSCCNFSDSER